MFDTSSRYAPLPTATLKVPDSGGDGGAREVRYVTRRIIAPAGDATTLVEHTVVQGERLDHIAARYAGDPTQFWRICDANNVADAETLETTGRVVRIAVPRL